MRILKFILFLFLNSFFVHGQDLDSARQKIVSDFINCIKYQNKEKLADKIRFPLRRKYPIPAINDKREFLKRYNEVFDDSLTKMIINSRPTKDWSEMGWQGIMLFNGELWLDDDGWLTAVNSHSKVENQEWEELVKREKANLHESIRDFKQPVCLIETTKYRIRIDDMGDWNYRYSAWPLQSKMSDKPELIIEKGEYIPDGSGGNHKYEFKNGEYIYDCYIIVMGEDGAPPALLEIFKGEKEVLSQKATKLED